MGQGPVFWSLCPPVHSRLAGLGGHEIVSVTCGNLAVNWNYGFLMQMVGFALAIFPFVWKKSVQVEREQVEEPHL